MYEIVKFRIGIMYKCGSIVEHYTSSVEQEYEAAVGAVDCMFQRADCIWLDSFTAIPVDSVIKVSLIDVRDNG